MARPIKPKPIRLVRIGRPARARFARASSIMIMTFVRLEPWPSSILGGNVKNRSGQLQLDGGIVPSQATLGPRSIKGRHQILNFAVLAQAQETVSTTRGNVQCPTVFSVKLGAEPVEPSG